MPQPKYDYYVWDMSRVGLCLFTTNCYSPRAIPWLKENTKDMGGDVYWYMNISLFCYTDRATFLIDRMRSAGMVVEMTDILKEKLYGEQ